MRDESQRSRATRFWLPPGTATNLVFLFGSRILRSILPIGSGGQLGNWARAFGCGSEVATAQRTIGVRVRNETSNADIEVYNEEQGTSEREICELLSAEIDKRLPEAQSKIWHLHPVWFLEDNPTVGYSKLKAGIRLMFWSGADFGEDRLRPGTGKFKDASITYTSVDEVRTAELRGGSRSRARFSGTIRISGRRRGS